MTFQHVCITEVLTSQPAFVEYLPHGTASIPELWLTVVWSFVYKTMIKFELSLQEVTALNPVLLFVWFREMEV